MTTCDTRTYWAQLLDLNVLLTTNGESIDGVVTEVYWEDGSWWICMDWGMAIRVDDSTTWEPLEGTP